MTETDIRYWAQTAIEEMLRHGPVYIPMAGPERALIEALRESFTAGMRYEVERIVSESQYFLGEGDGYSLGDLGIDDIRFVEAPL